jgi:hypothetical protein
MAAPARRRIRSMRRTTFLLLFLLPTLAFAADRDRGGWRQYRDAGTCIGGNECRKNGTRILVPLEDAPVLGVRFHAHDNVGTRADGRLNVRIDDTTIASYVDVARNGKLHDFEVNNVRGSKLVISTATDDEVVISDIEVLYGRGDSRGDHGRDDDRGGYGRHDDREHYGPREMRHEGGCIGGAECGGSRAKIRIALHGRHVASVSFFAHDNVGQRAGGELRIRLDDQILRDYLDIPREGRTFTIEARGQRGEFLIIETAKDDEVVIKDVRIRFDD